MKFSQIKTILIVSLLISSTGCKTKKQTDQDICKNDNRVVVYFDIKEYFCDIISEYNTTKIRVNKQVSFGNKSESKENMEIDWGVELQTFAASDINRSSWIEKFKVDTLTTNNGSTILYQTTDASVPIKKLEIMLSPTGEVSEIVIQSERKSILYKSKQRLNFRPGNSYSIAGWQRTLMLSQTDFEVKADILGK